MQLGQKLIGKHLISNLLGRGIQGAALLLAAPLYIRLIDWESYGLIGLFNALYMMLNACDFGLGITVNRECARMRVAVDAETSRVQTANLIRTAEFIYIALTIGVIIIGLATADFFSQHWLNSKALSQSELVRSLKVMVIALAAYFPSVLYSNGLLGAGFHYETNLVQTLTTVLRLVAGLGVLFYTPKISVFFLTQAVFFLIQALVLRWVLLNRLMIHSLGRFRIRLIKNLRAFALEVSGGNLLAIGIVQADKVVLSCMLPLADYGQYILYASLASTIPFVCQPIFISFFPLLTGFFESNNFKKLNQNFILGAVLVSMVSIPLVLLIVGFSNDILQILGKGYITDLPMGNYVFALLAISQGVSVAMIMPLAAQLACKWARLERRKNMVWLALLVPLLIFFSRRNGLVGGVNVILVTSLLGTIVSIAVFFRYIMSEVKSVWLNRCIVRPWVVSLGVLALMKFFAKHFSLPPLGGITFCYVMILFGLATLCKSELWALITSFRRSVNSTSQS